MERALLIVLDGFGIGKDSAFNAIKNADMPFYKDLVKKYPTSQLLTHGEAVGLPEGVMGNSEVGHMTMGAGRVIYQDLTRISKSIREGEFFKLGTLIKAVRAGAKSRVHFMGLLSDGGVHSHIDHLKACLDLCIQEKIPNVSVHLFMDGRDTPPKSGIEYLKDLLRHPAFGNTTPTHAVIGSMSGRYYPMDRDKRWERVALGYKAMTGQMPACVQSPEQALQNSYDADKTDEFVEPMFFSAPISDGDSVIFFNYRADRAREISEAFTSKAFAGFERGHAPKLSSYIGMTVYDKNLGIEAAYAPQSFEEIFGIHLESQGLKQFRIAETEKYAHVTFFFNGGREAAFKGEDRVLIPSPKEVATYDLKPEMSAFAVAEEAQKRLLSKVYDFTLMNFANADMVGHTGNYEAAVRAMEALDKCLAKVVGAAQASDTHVLITADHGNAEEMRDCNGEIHTQHTLNPVPAIWVAPKTSIAPKKDRLALHDGSLADIMPTLCQMMGLSIPKPVTGKCLLP